jgi:hypothetical protein
MVLPLVFLSQIEDCSALHFRLPFMLMWITNYTLVNQNKNNEMTTCKDSPMFKSMRILKEQIKKLTGVEYCAISYSIMHSNTCSKKEKHIAIT